MGRVFNDCPSWIKIRKIEQKLISVQETNARKFEELENRDNIAPFRSEGEERTESRNSEETQLAISY